MSLDKLFEGPIAVLLGGNSAEREISLLSGQTVVAALQSLGCGVRAVDPADPDWMAQLQGVTCAFIALHGPGGEDGSMQGALQTMGIPYTGSLATGGFVTLAADTDWQQVIDRFSKVFVKPACEGSSIGMASADSAVALQRAYKVAANYSGEVLAEQFIDGPEYTVAVLGDQALPSIRMETDNDFYDYEAKYLSQETRYHCPSDLNGAEEAQIAELALRMATSMCWR